MTTDDTVEPLDNGVQETYTFDVGQADARFTITENGKLILADADIENVGAKLDQVLAGRTGAQMAGDRTTIDLFLCTHHHNDHVDGLDSLYDNYEIQDVVQPHDSRFEITDPETENPKKGVRKPVINKYANDLEKLNTDNIYQVSSGDKYPMDEDTDIRVLAPPDTEDSVDVTRAATGADVNFRAKHANENGAVYKLEGERSALFMGDVQDDSHHHAESWLMQQHDDPEIDVDLSADVLFVAHHGSANATSEEFLERVDPELAIISSDFGEQHGHPTDEVLKNLYNQDVAVSWTAGHGTVRTDLDDALTTEQTTDLDTTNAADLAALKHYCREHDVSPEQIAALTPDHLPDKTPEWVAESAPMLVETTEEIVDAAIANGETVEDVRHTLEATPDAHESLRAGVQADRDEHVTTRADVKRNREAYFSAKRKERDYERLPLHTRLRTKLPSRFGGINHPLEDVPSSDEITGPRDVSVVSRAVKTPPAAEKRAQDEVFIADHFTSAEEAAATAVETAETADTLCQSLRETPGAHKDFLYAIDTPNAHTAHETDHDLSETLEQTNTNQREQTSGQTPDQDPSLSL